MIGPPDYDCADMDLAHAGQRIYELEEENKKLRHAAKLIAKRKYMTSGNLEMAKCDEYCKELGLRPCATRRGEKLKGIFASA